MSDFDEKGIVKSKDIKWLTVQYSKTVSGEKDTEVGIREDYLTRTLIFSLFS